MGSLCATGASKGWPDQEVYLSQQPRIEMFGVVARSSDADRSSREDAIKAAQERKKDRGVDRPVSKESKEEARVERKKAEKTAAVNKFLTEKGDAKDKVTLSEMISKKQEGKADK